MTNRRSYAIWRIIGLLVGFGIIIFFPSIRNRIQDAVVDFRKPTLPTAMPYPSMSTSVAPVATRTPEPTAMPSSANLAVPFVSQAPKMIWDADHEEFCEEAAALMAASYIHSDTSVTNPDVADSKLYAIKDWELKNLGHFEDTTALETARILREHLGVAKVQVMPNPTEDQIKDWLSQGRVVLVPAAGRELGNPNFTAPGPIYHMVLLKGYTADGLFIANDPGTRKGANYIYSASTIMSAMHDWNTDNIDAGRKVVIVVG